MPLLGVLSLIGIISMVLVRVRMLASHGITAVRFGSTDTRDFFILPFALLYVYSVVAGAFGQPVFGPDTLFESPFLEWVGLLFCVSAVALMALSLVSFGKSFRVGIDTDKPDALVTSGVFAFTRNPIYVAFAFVLAGEFSLQPYPLLRLYLIGGTALFHRQVLREEAFSGAHHGAAYEDYARRVRRCL